MACKHRSVNTSTDGLRAGDEERSGEDSECHASEASVRSAPSRLFVDVRNLSEFAAAAYPKPDFTAAIAGIGNLSKLTADAYPKPDFTAAIAGIGNLSKLTAVAYANPDFTAAP